MPMNEFKARLESFECSFTGDAPNEAQWAVIKAKILKIEPVKTQMPGFRNPLSGGL